MLRAMVKQSQSRDVPEGLRRASARQSTPTVGAGPGHHLSETQDESEQTSLHEWLDRLRQQPPISVDELPEIVIRRHRDAG